MERFYSLLETKSFDGEKGILVGTATAITPDRIGDVIVPEGLTFDLPFSLLDMHSHGLPIGSVVKLKVLKSRVDFEAQLADPDKAESVEVRERLLKARDEIKLGLKRGISVGILPVETERVSPDSFARKFVKAKLFELSVVTIPMHQSATIATMKSLLSEQSPASGHSIVRLSPRDIHRATRREGAVYL